VLAIAKPKLHLALLAVLWKRFGSTKMAFVAKQSGCPQERPRCEHQNTDGGIIECSLKKVAEFEGNGAIYSQKNRAVIR
jgi:hypothetical protein